MEVERVQSIASNLLKESDAIPSEYIRSEKEQPAITTRHGVVLEVPVIDLNGEEEEDLVRLISEASREWGIFQVVNHGIPVDVISKLQEVGKQFFELPQEEKEVIAKPPPSSGSKSIEGYGTSLQKDAEGKKGWVDHLFHILWPPSSINYKFWPQNPPSYRSVLFSYIYIYICFEIMNLIYIYVCVCVCLEKQTRNIAKDYEGYQIGCSNVYLWDLDLKRMSLKKDWVEKS